MKPTVISLFAGAGGLDIGLERAGFHTIAATDVDRDCIDTLRLNQATEVEVGGGKRAHLQGSLVVDADVAELTASDLNPTGQDIDLLAGGPPCQPFSSAGRQLALSDPRGQLFSHFVRLADELQPRFVLFENVRGLVTARGHCGTPGEALQSVVQGFEDIGYATRCGLLNSADYGAAQRRVRFFLIASRIGAAPPLPAPTHSRLAETTDGKRPWVTLGDFLATRPSVAEDEHVRPSEALAPLLAALPMGSGLKSPGRAEPTRPGGHWGYRQGTFIADTTRPARTVTAATTQDWIRLADGSLRRLTLSECAGLQGFPMKWQFHGTQGSKFRQVGNAVPVVLGEALGRELVVGLSTEDEQSTIRFCRTARRCPPRHSVRALGRRKERSRSSAFAVVQRHCGAT